MPSRAPGVYRPATATHQLWNLLSSLINGWDVTLSLSCRCPDFLSCSFPSVFFPLLFLCLTLPVSFHSLFSSFTPLFQGLPGQLHEMLHSPLFLSIIHHFTPLLRPVVHLQSNPQGPQQTPAFFFFFFFLASGELPHLHHPHSPIFIPPQYCSPDTSLAQHILLLNGSACAKVLLLTALMRTLLKFTVISLFTVSHFKELLHLSPYLGIMPGIEKRTCAPHVGARQK